MSRVPWKSTATRWGWPALIVTSTCAAVATAALDVHGPARVLTAMWFLTVCPGMAWVRVLRLDDAANRWTVAIAASLSLEVFLGAVMAFAQLWEPFAGLAILAAVALSGAIADIVGFRHRASAPGGTRS